MKFKETAVLNDLIGSEPTFRELVDPLTDPNVSAEVVSLELLFPYLTEVFYAYLLKNVLFLGTFEDSR